MLLIWPRPIRSSPSFSDCHPRPRAPAHPSRFPPRKSQPPRPEMAEAALIRKLDETEGRFQSLQDSLNDPAVLTNSQRMIAASKESGQLDPIVRRYREYKQAR